MARIVFKGSESECLSQGVRIEGGAAVTSIEFADGEPSALRIATTAWHSVGGAFAAMPVSFLLAAGGVAVAQIAQRMLVDASLGTAILRAADAAAFPVKSAAVSLAYGGLKAAALALVALPVFRMVLRDETTSTAELASARTLRLVAWLVGYQVLSSAVLLLATFMRAFAPLHTSFVNTATLITVYSLIVEVALFYLWVRFGLLYASVALDRPESIVSRLREAWRLSGARQWRLIWSAILAFLPLYILIGSITVFAFVWAGPAALSSRGGIRWGDLAAANVAAVVGAALGAAILAWNYRLSTGRHFDRMVETFA